MSNFKNSELPNLNFHEVDVLSKFERNSFIQKLISSFHDYDNLYFVSKFYEGYILNYLDKFWNENQIQFFAACLIQSLTHLRKEQYIHRDVHFGNLVLDKDYYIILIDFHIAIEYKNKNNPNNNIVGSPELCAPEMINNSIYDYNSDYYRLGSMIYYIIFRQYPNYIRKEKNITNIVINNENINYSESCIDFINKLIITDYKKRIGFDNINELINHKFFRNFSWNQLINKQMKSPFNNGIIRDLGLCRVLYNFTKRIFINRNLLKNNTFKNIFINYDKINLEIRDIIFISYKSSNSLKEKNLY